MNFEKLVDSAKTIVLAVALTGNLNKFTKFIHLQTQKLIFESRANSWGRPPILGGGPHKWSR
jgi:hypothetical protein